MSRAAPVLVLVAALAAGCTAPAGPGAGAAPAASPQRVGQPTARDLEFLVGAWRQLGDGRTTSWEVWAPTDRGFEGSAWQASRGISRRTERLELELTLEGWVLTPVLFDDLEREYPSDPFPLAAWGEGWVRFENPAHERPHTIAYRRTGPESLEAWIVSRGADGADERRGFRFVAMRDDERH